MALMCCNIQTYAGSHQDEILKSRDRYVITPDRKGTLRRSDTGEAVAYYGTNYTLPFAHAWRAVNALGLNPKRVADMDIYHMKRLGLNGFRLHLWDVELADSVGNLLENEHLDMLDYMIAALEKEGIDIVLTAQTNFGNGYPERNIDTGSYSYRYDKCSIHEDPEAQKAQERYLTALASHVNPYTGKTYGKDKGIIAIEINNEPCHSGSRKEVTAYINRMKRALRKGGFDRMVLYNVSHNPDVTEAYYNADIDGTTYQWYPDGLVAGHERKGNLLPYVDEYPVPWKKSMKNYDRLSRFVYEFDPGDVLSSYLYPAIARTFRKEGFQWATQFAYDPTPIAPFNTEYQTHYLNLLYTPAKALSMAVAARVMQEVPEGMDYGSFPADTVFGNFRVSHRENLSEYNTPERFIHTGTTSTAPRDMQALRHLWGVGSSPAARYTGTGAYFLDRIDCGGGSAVWRLEVLPDAVIVSDPFRKPSPEKEVARIYFNENRLALNLPELDGSYHYKGINEGNSVSGESLGGEIAVAPGVYLLSADTEALEKAASALTAADRRFAAAGVRIPDRSGNPLFLGHTPPAAIEAGAPLLIEAEIFSDLPVDSVVVYPSDVSFWRTDNQLVHMKEVSPRHYVAEMPQSRHGASGEESYNIVVFTADGAVTWPQNSAGTPLDWDFDVTSRYSVARVSADQPLTLMKPSKSDSQLESTLLPEGWDYRVTFIEEQPCGQPLYDVTAGDRADKAEMVVMRRYVADMVKGNPSAASADSISLYAPAPLSGNETVALTDSYGITYGAPLSEARVEPQAEGVVYTLPLEALRPIDTFIVPTPFPTFLPRTAAAPASDGLRLHPADIEAVELRFPAASLPARVGTIWLR